MVSAFGCKNSSIVCLKPGISFSQSAGATYSDSVDDRVTQRGVMLNYATTAPAYIIAPSETDRLSFYERYA